MWKSIKNKFERSYSGWGVYLLFQLFCIVPNDAVWWSFIVLLYLIFTCNVFRFKIFCFPINYVYLNVYLVFHLHLQCFIVTFCNAFYDMLSKIVNCFEIYLCVCVCVIEMISIHHPSLDI